jgi:hypothetical protein
VSHDHARRHSSGSLTAPTASAGLAPGRRALTDGMSRSSAAPQPALAPIQRKGNGAQAPGGDLVYKPGGLGDYPTLVAAADGALPAELRAKLERMSGIDLRDVRVHRNSDRPASVGALAFAQGNEIHLGPGQEQHLPHEAWHVVQQRQGRVGPMPQRKSASPVVDDPDLEAEADEMGARAATGVDLDPGASSASGAATSAAPILPKRGQPALPGPGAPGPGALGGAFSLLDLLPDGVRPLVQGLLRAAQAGELTISASQGQTLLRLLRELVADPALYGRPPDDAVAPGGPPPPPVALSSVLRLVLGVDVTPFLGGHDLLIDAAWFVAHPLIIDVPPPRARRDPPAPDGAPALPAPVPDFDPFAGGDDLQRLLRDLLANPIRLDLRPPRNPAPVLALPAPDGGLPRGPDLPIPPAIRQYLLHHQPHLALAIAVLAELEGAVAPATALVAAILAQGVDPAEAPTLARLVRSHAPVSAPQVQRAVTIFVRSGEARHVQRWLAGARTMANPAAAPNVGAAAGPAPAPALDVLLGAGAHAAIRTAIQLNGRRYGARSFVHGQAMLMRAGHVPAASVQTVLVALCTHIDREAVFARAVRVAIAMFRGLCPLAEITTFLTAHPAEALAGDHEALLVGPGGVAGDGLVARGQVTAARLVAVLGMLAPLGAAPAAALLNQRFPATLQLTLARLHDRLDELLTAAPAGQGLTIQQTDTAFGQLEQSIQQRLHNGQMTANSASWARQAFRLLVGATRAQMQAFLGDGRVTPLLAAAQNANPAYHLLQFARYHTGAPPGGFATVPVVVPHHTGPRTVDVDAWIIDHVRERHTFENFSFTPAIIDRAPQSTMFNPPVGDGVLLAQIQQILGNGAVTGGGWGGAIDVGAVQLRLGHVVGRGPNWVLTQYFYSAGAGQPVPRDVLRAIHAAFPFL